MRQGNICDWSALGRFEGSSERKTTKLWYLPRTVSCVTHGDRFFRMLLNDAVSTLDAV
jgi:hypothetical protein